MEIEAQNNRLAQEASQAGLEDNMEAIQRLYEGGVLFDYFRQLIFALASLYKEDLSPLPEEIRAKILGTRDRIAEGSGSIFDRTRPIEEDVAGIRTWIDYELSKGQSDVVLPYVQSSAIRASRDIIVAGQGALYSDLSAGRAVKVQGSPGIVRGGERCFNRFRQTGPAVRSAATKNAQSFGNRKIWAMGNDYPDTTP